jgi:hypothetical protein|tara:strand:- start:3142 stop:3381 length:240 start_codon:yes stop_codon:yes gene_type:complete
MKLSELTDKYRYTQLSHDVLAVLSIGPDGYRVYVGAVPGKNHDDEWAHVASQGTKQREPMAAAIVTTALRFEVDLPYAR